MDSNKDIEVTKSPQEHLKEVRMGGTGILIPDTPSYNVNDGLETKGLANCTGVAMYIPEETGPFLVVSHLMLTQRITSIVDALKEQIQREGKDVNSFMQKEGFLQIVPGKTTDSRKRVERERQAQIDEELKKHLPNLKPFPEDKTKFADLGHMSSGIKLTKDGTLTVF